MNVDFDNYRNWKGWNDDRSAMLRSSDRVYFDAEFADSEVTLAGAQIFELGFRNGNFLSYYRKRQAQAAWMEIDADLVARAKVAGIEAHLYADAAIEALGDNRFDAVVAFDVFEHINFHDLQGLLGRLRRIFRPGGIIMARFPSGGSPLVGAMYNGDATHCTLIGTGELNQLAITSGLEIVQMRGARLPLSGLGVATIVKRAGIIGLRRLIAAVLAPVYYQNARRMIDPNAVCVLRKRVGEA